MRLTGSSGPRAGYRARQAWWRKSRVAVAGAVAAVALTGTSLAAPPPASASATEDVIVTSAGLLSPVTSVLELGGSILQQFSIIDGVEAEVPTLLEPLLAALPGITVTPNAAVTVESTTPPPVSTAPHTPSDVFLQQTGATQLAAAGDTGQGVTVAVMDTGIDNLPDFAGRLIGGVDLSGEGNPFQDSYGHGTFVAGLIAGDGASSGGEYSGEAPGANLVAIKVAGASGVTHLSTLIEGLAWAITHESQYDIKVLNISLGFQADMSTVINPLDQAVEAAWNSGITVVVSAGNAGPFNGTILSPGDDPLVITVGALDDMASTSASGDEMTDFSSAGPTSPDGWVKPDLVTSGRSVVSLAAPGSTVYDDYPSARVGAANFVGSGTSFSAAITSGAAALVLADNPNLTPDQVKARLLGTTNPGPVGNPFVDGHGALNAYAAATSGPMNLSQSTSLVLPTLPGATVSLAPTGPADSWNLHLWSGLGVTQAPATSWAWNSWSWNGAAWNGAAWNSWAWNSWAWNDAAWNSWAWNSWAWNDAAWQGSVWDGTAWNGTSWNSSSWS